LKVYELINGKNWLISLICLRYWKSIQKMCIKYVLLFFSKKRREYINTEWQQNTASHNFFSIYLITKIFLKRTHGLLPVTFIVRLLYDIIMTSYNNRTTKMARSDKQRVSILIFLASLEAFQTNYESAQSRTSFFKVKLLIQS